MTPLRIAIAALLGAAGAAAIVSCIDTSGTTITACPSEAVFTGLGPDGGADGGPSATPVSEYMSRRCGTLDCHGSIPIPMRIYGQYGLRYPAESNVPGGKPTTDAELQSNYGVVCGLQPVQTTAAVTDPNSADQFLIVLKSRGLMSHKGGAVVKEGDPGDECISGWLRSDDPATVAAACQAAIDGL